MPVVARRTSDPRTGSSPSGALLPTGGTLAPVQPPAPERTLAAEARRLVRRVADPAPLPAAWSEAAFVREVRFVRAHLEPIRSRGGLVASFSREAFHANPGVGRADLSGAPHDEVPGPVRVAYALRWLELGSRRHLADWPPSRDTHPPAI